MCQYSTYNFYCFNINLLLFFLRNRCDIKHDCSDESDEISCDYLRTDKNYAKELLPIDSGKRPCLVYINASFLAFPSIDTSTLKFTADLYLHLRWYDFRVSFKDLNNITTLNGLSEVDREALWTPRLDFINALGPIQVVMDDLSSGVLIRQSDPIPEDITLETEGRHQFLQKFWSSPQFLYFTIKCSITAHKNVQ